MVWIRLILCGIAFCSIAGSVSFGMIKLAEKLLHLHNPLLLLTMHKASLVLYWLPVSLACVCIPRISLENGVMSYCGEFVCSTVPSMSVVFLMLGCVWLAGFFVSVLRAVRGWQRLAKLERGNVPAEEARLYKLFAESREHCKVESVTLVQNDLLQSPVTTGIFRKRIILPFADYTNQELRMIYAHELTHIQNKDLLWRLLGLVTSWVHWFNPAIYAGLRELACQQEMVCDFDTAADNVHFTKKEYASFLARLTDSNAFACGKSTLYGARRHGLFFGNIKIR